MRTAAPMLYKAFISYSHAADGKLAPSLQRALHRIAKPWYRLRTMRVFRDQTNLATSPGLWTVIEQALSQSEFFIFLASPTAAQSPWVQKSHPGQSGKPERQSCARRIGRASRHADAYSLCHGRQPCNRKSR